MQCVGWLCLGLALWAILVPVRLFFTWLGIRNRGVGLCVMLLCVVGVALGFDVPVRWMQAVEHHERARARAAGEARRDPARVTEKALAGKDAPRVTEKALVGKDAPRGRGLISPPAPQSDKDRRREAAAAARARARYEIEQRRLEQSGTGRAIERQQRR